MTMTARSSAPSAAPVTRWWTRIRHRSLRLRLALWALLLLGIGQAVMSLALYLAISAWLLGQVDSSLLLTTNQLASIFYDPEDPLNPLDISDVRLKLADTSLVTRSFMQEQGFFVRLIDTASGEVLAASAAADAPWEGAPVMAAGYQTRIADAEEGRPEQRIFTLHLVYQPQVALQVGVSLAALRAIQRDIRSTLLVLLLVTSALAPLSGWFLAARALAPIRAVARTAAETNERQLDRRLDLADTEVELVHLVQTFNAMLDRIAAAFQRQRQFTADAAHELRTPLAIMQTGLEVTLSHPRAAADYRAALESVQEEVARLSHLANSLLLLARADAHALPLARAPFDLSQTLHAVADQFAPLAEEKGIRLTRRITPGLTVTGDQDRLIQVILNLLDNAVKFTPAGGQVQVSAQAEGQQVVWSVGDSGPGIPPEEQARVFDRFTRLDSARRRQTGGAGLGLAIVKQIVELHGGSVRVISASDQGAQVVVTLPQ